MKPTTAATKTEKDSWASRRKEGQAAVRELLQGMRVRLLHMEDVARWKWNAGQTTADPRREQALLDHLMAKATVADKELAREFLLAQMQAAKQVQQGYFKRWEMEGHGPFSEVPDLATVQRPHIDRISQELLAALVRARPYLQDPAVRESLLEEARSVLQGEGITDQVRETALAPLLKR